MVDELREVTVECSTKNAPNGFGECCAECACCTVEAVGVDGVARPRYRGRKEITGAL